MRAKPLTGPLHVTGMNLNTVCQATGWRHKSIEEGGYAGSSVPATVRYRCHEPDRPESCEDRHTFDPSLKST